MTFGNPAGSLTLNQSSIKNGSRVLRFETPINLLTLAPSPSGYSLAENI